MAANYSQNQAGAVVGILKTNSPLFSNSYGLANIEREIPIQVNTVFGIGSITKQFTSVGILMLVEEKKLKLNDPITKFYPELFKNHPLITISQLLSHTAGVLDFAKIPAIRKLIETGTNTHNLISIISEQELDFQPGEAYSYSNSGYLILGGILEQLSGLYYEQFLMERIFKPLAMHDTFLSKNASNKAMGYYKRPEKFVKAPIVHPSLLFSAGGIWSTVGDMSKWNIALNKNLLIKKKSKKLAFNGYKLNDGTIIDYGFGFRNAAVNGIPSMEHGGGAFGYNSYGISVPKKGIYVILLSNFQRENRYDQVAAEITALVLEKPYTENLKPKISNRHFNSYVGKYTFLEESISFKRSQNKFLMVKNDEELELIPLSKNTFELSKSFDERVIFQKNGVTIKPRRSNGKTFYKLR